MDKIDYRVKIEWIDIIEKSLYKVQIFEEEVFNFEVITQAIADSSKSAIVTFVIVNIRRMNEANDLVAKIMIAVGFVVENFENAFKKDENNSYPIPIEFENTVKMMSISTMRGIMFSEFRGTRLHKAILPIILADSLKPLEGKNINDL